MCCGKLSKTTGGQIFADFRGEGLATSWFQRLSLSFSKSPRKTVAKNAIGSFWDALSWFRRLSLSFSESPRKTVVKSASESFWAGCGWKSRVGKFSGFWVWGGLPGKSLLSGIWYLATLHLLVPLAQNLAKICPITGGVHHIIARLSYSWVHCHFSIKFYSLL